MTTTTKTKLTIRLSDRSPITIVKEDWPRIASDSDHDGQVRCQANEEWWINVRRHSDGRTVVYGAIESGPGGCPRGWHDKHAGYLLPAGCTDDDVVRAIRRIAGVINQPDMADRVIADLPAEEIQ